MPHVDDALLRDAFRRYHAGSEGRVRPAGAAAAFRAVSIRRRNRRFTMAGAVAMLATLSVAALTMAARPYIAPLAITPAPVPSDSIPPGGFTLAKLTRVALPAFQGDTSGDCSGPAMDLTRNDGHIEVVNTTGDRLTYVDVDHDGTFEAVLWLRCLLVQPPSEQVLVLERGSGGGQEVLVKGTVVRTDDQIKQLGGVTPMTDGSILVNVRDKALATGVRYTDVTHQWRGYAWDGMFFERISGARTFLQPNGDPDLAITMSGLAFGPPDAVGQRSGKVSITVRNAGAVPVHNVTLGLQLAYAHPSGSEQWVYHLTLPGPNEPTLRRQIGSLAAGASLDVEVALFTGDVDLAKVKVGAFAIPLAANGDQLRDANPDDNEGASMLAGIQAAISFS